MSYHVYNYHGFAIPVSVVMDYVKESTYDRVESDLAANNYKLPYPIYCFEDDDQGSFFVFHQAQVVSHKSNPEPLKVYSDEEIATMIIDAMRLDLDLNEAGIEDELFEALVDEFSTWDLICRG